MADRLHLKFGMAKEVALDDPKCIEIYRRYRALRTGVGLLNGDDTPEAKLLLCELIDALGGRIVNEWTGETMTKEAAKRYVMGR